jgi:hypothetical protein
MYKFAGEVQESKSKYEKAAMAAMTARLDYLYNYNKDVKVEDKKTEYLRSRDQYRRMKQEYENVVMVPNIWDKTGLTLETLKKSTIRLPVDGKTTAFKVLYDMEERLNKVKYSVPENGALPPVHELLWIDM